MDETPVPKIQKCLDFMGVKQPNLSSFQSFRQWVIAHHQPGANINAPGITGWKYQVPFWTKNVKRQERQLFQKYTHYVKKPEIVDTAVGLQLLHEYWCTGASGNNRNRTVVRTD